MGVLGTLKYRREIFRHGGTEVLRLEVLAPDVPPANGGRQNIANEKQKIPEHMAKNRQKRRREKLSTRSGTAFISGENEAARHLAALVLELENFVRKNIVQEARQDLDAAAAAGCGYRFARYLCRIVCEEKKQRGKAELIVRFLVTSGGQTRHEAQLCSIWDADGSLQCGPRRCGIFPPRIFRKRVHTYPRQNSRQPFADAENNGQQHHPHI